jgi:hypothetical protein
MWGNTNDDNGVLLYPDREPRFMLMYTGGDYGDHGSAVGATGLKNVQDFFNNGGSYEPRGPERCEILHQGRLE